MLHKPVLLIFLVLACCICANAQKKSDKSPFQHVEPAFWWVGMKNTDVQILFHSTSTNLTDYQVTTPYAGVTVTKTEKVENPHYLFVTLRLAPSVQAGKVPLTFTSGKKSWVYTYELKTKAAATNRIGGFSPADVLYLIMPDRFANGNPKNDTLPGMFEGVHRNQPYGRHGGDLKGIADHLSYFKELGVTTLWLNPVLENNQKTQSYHGYAITDLYQVDRRFGTNPEYVDFVNQCHQQGLKVVQDMVMNHIGNEHWLMHDLPAKDWVHQFPEFTRSNFRTPLISDPYQSKYDAEQMTNGWFDTHMPDVNQTNPQFATYLIQNTLWWIEYAGIDGIRMDTYPYPDKTFMATLAKAVLNEYPAFNLVGETWMESVASMAYWQKGMKNKDGYDSHLPSLTDFPLCFAISTALTEKAEWDKGMTRLYNTLSQDFMYPDANQNLTFVDNHDMTRFFTSVKKDVNKFKMGMAFLLTTRGIPQLYYGDEILMDGDGSVHPDVRKDFPGGWPGDKVNAFTVAGRTKEQNEVFTYMKTLLNWRKTKTVLHEGKLTHYIPQENIYVYFRHNASESVMVVMNGNDVAKSLDTKRFAENLKGFTKATNVTTGEALSVLENLSIPAQTALVLELH
jgi:glycosidase